MAVAPAAEAAIQYSGLQNNLMLTATTEGSDTSYRLIDLDGDDTADFVIVHKYVPDDGFSAFIVGNPSESAGVIKYDQPPPVGYYAKALTANYNISNSLTGSGAWGGSHPKYLGVNSSGPFEDQLNPTYIG